MADTTGHFRNGRWVEETDAEEEPVLSHDPAPENTAGDDMEIRIQAAKESVSHALQDVLDISRDIITTKEGHKHVEKTIEKTGSLFEKLISDVVSYTEKTLSKKKKE
ncbi:MAG: hypothetical protein JXA44_12245 [Methanospirillaceae archaeon]|nr:hypothetical protein [Methanospirillaceae archaeon]